MTYYNENDPKAAAWLRELIKAGHIAPGDVDERSITEVSPHEITGYTQQHFFAGIGGWSYALRLAGWPDDRPVRTGSCPCQPFSAAGKGLAEKDDRHLWPVFRDLITFGEPTITFGEQVASAAGRLWLSRVRADLEGLGYAVGAADLCAAGVGSPQIRQRLWWVAYPNGGKPRNRRLQRRREHGQQPENGGVGRMEHAAGHGWQQRGAESIGRGSFSGCISGWLADGRCYRWQQVPDAVRPGQHESPWCSQDGRERERERETDCLVGLRPQLATTRTEAA